MIFALLIEEAAPVVTWQEKKDAESLVVYQGVVLTRQFKEHVLNATSYSNLVNMLRTRYGSITESARAQNGMFITSWMANISHPGAPKVGQQRLRKRSSENIVLRNGETATAVAPSKHIISSYELIR